MIPIRNNNPTRSFPFLTILLIVVNVYVYYNQVVLGDFGDQRFTGMFGFVPYELTHNSALVGVVHIDRLGNSIFYPGEKAILAAQFRHSMIPIGPPPHPIWAAIFTAMFMHGSLLHLAGNMLFLWIFGSNLEDTLGTVRFLFFYFICGLAAALAQTASDPDSLIPNIGASGAIAGVMGAYLVLWPKAKILTIIPILFFWILREIYAFWVLFIWIGVQIATVYFQLGGQSTGGVAYFAHIGGFFAGIVLILLYGGQKLLQPSKGRRRPDFTPD
jgi:membrane associated rhomboid family serine protease